MTERPFILAIDAGGTLTDTIVLGDKGTFTVGKAQTTAEDEAKGFERSLEDALIHWNSSVSAVMPKLRTGVYSGTGMLNRLLERQGKKIGVIVTAGMEDYFTLERGVQTHLGYSYSDRLHVATHAHNEPIVPRHLMIGVRGRIDAKGAEAIPLYEHEVEEGIKYLLEQGVEAICISFLFSFREPAHEERARAIAERVMESCGRAVPVTLSSDICPMRLDFPRLNTLVVEAYAAEPSRNQLYRIRDKVRETGGTFEPRVMASHGGTIGIDTDRLSQTLVSGPIGGVIGGKYLSDRVGIDNLVCSDIGGTSFDVALIADGQYHIRNDPYIGHYKLNMAHVQIDSIGAGTGTFVRVNPTSKRIEFGPDSAGARIGVSNLDGDVDEVSVTDCNLVLGYINPDYFLGGQIPLDKNRAWKKIDEQIAGPLGLSVEAAAGGAVELMEEKLKQELSALVLGKGFEPVEFTLLCYGGGGPVHVCGYTDGLSFDRILVPSWASAFSAFGCACADFEYRREKQIDVEIIASQGGGDRNWKDVVRPINEAWSDLRDQIIAEFERSDVAADEVRFTPMLKMQYMGQLNDIEVPSRTIQLESTEDIQTVIDEFESVYGRIYANTAKSPELGYYVTTAILTGTVQTDKPFLTQEDGSSEPDRIAGSEAEKGERDIYWRGSWYPARLYELDRLRPGDRIVGPAVVESPAMSFLVAPDRTASLDANRIFNLRRT